jgi:DNA replication protein DnaC
VLILDDFGLKPLSTLGPEDFYDVINERYERGSLIVTSNRLCPAGHKRFNAESIVMRGLVARDPARASV